VDLPSGEQKVSNGAVAYLVTFSHMSQGVK
jgi:hypothetical protein